MTSERFHLRIPCWHWGRDGTGNPVRVDDPTLEVEVEVSVDFEGLANAMGRRAAFSKSRKSVEAGGLVVVRSIHQKVSDTQP